jgi:hypothetical protein
MLPANRMYYITFSMVTVYLLVNLHFLYRFYINGMRLIPLSPVLLCMGFLSYQLRAVVGRMLLRRSLIVIAYGLFACGLAVMLYYDLTLRRPG